MLPTSSLAVNVALFKGGFSSPATAGGAVFLPSLRQPLARIGGRPSSNSASATADCASLASCSATADVSSSVASLSPGASVNADLSDPALGSRAGAPLLLAPRCDAHCVPDRQRHSIRNCGRRQGNHLPQRIPEDGVPCGSTSPQLRSLTTGAHRNARPLFFILASEPARMHAPGPLTACLLPMHRYCYDNEP